MASIPDKPALSNRLADLAERAGEAARAYRRGSIESIRAYLSAGEILAEARGECRRGEWGAVLDRAGIESRTARRMMQAWRIAKQAGASAEAIHDAGGVQAFVQAAFESLHDALHRAADGLEDGEGEPEKTVLKTVIEPPHEADSPGPDRGIGEIPRSLPDSPARDDSASIPPADDGLTPAQRRRQARRDAGLCIDCSRATDGWHVRCPACRARIAATDKRRREDAKLGAVLGLRIRDAARHGRGIRLTAADVAGLVAGDGKRPGSERSPGGRKR